MDYGFTKKVVSSYLKSVKAIEIVYLLEKTHLIISFSYDGELIDYV